MSKSFKFKNNMYLDSSSIAHDKITLFDMLSPSNRKGVVLKDRISNIDFNDLYNRGSGLFVINSTANAPSANTWYNVIQTIMTDGNGYALQLAIKLFVVDDYTLYVRKKHNGNWSAWKSIAFS